MTTSNTTTSRRTRFIGSLALTAALALGALAVTPIASLAQDGDSVTVATATDELGTYLVGPDGMTLYSFTRDVTPGISVCMGPCLEAWPPLLVADGQELVAGEGVTGTLGAVPREDGSMQATYRGRPLYYWQADTEPGQTTG